MVGAATGDNLVKIFTDSYGENQAGRRRWAVL
jgi:hypothetical protein